MYSIKFWNWDRARPYFVGLTTFWNVLSITLVPMLQSFFKCVPYHPQEFVRFPEAMSYYYVQDDGLSPEWVFIFIAKINAKSHCLQVISLTWFIGFFRFFTQMKARSHYLQDGVPQITHQNKCKVTLLASWRVFIYIAKIKLHSLQLIDLLMIGINLNASSDYSPK